MRPGCVPGSGETPMPRRSFNPTFIAAWLALGACAPTVVHGHPGNPTVPVSSSPNIERKPARVAGVSLEIEDAYGRPFERYRHRGQTYIAGQWGDRYAIRLTNHSRDRVEVVVTVDGRDV